MKSLLNSVVPMSKKRPSSSNNNDVIVTSSRLSELCPRNGQSYKAAADFGHLLFKYYLDRKETANCVISPVSAFFCISALKQGANGITKTELEKALCIGSKSSGNEAQDVMKTLERSSDDKFLLTTANGLFLKRSFAPLPEFESILRSDFNAVVETVDFGSMEGVKKVNAWVEKETKGKIKGVIEAPDGDTVFALINTVYMKGTWFEEFRNSNKGNFKVSNFHVVKTDLMRRMLQDASYYRDYEAKFALAFLPYITGEHSFWEFQMGVLLPDDSANLNSFSQYLHPDSLQRIKSRASLGMLDVILPKFKVEASINLIPVLERMGVRSAFTDEADFSGISNNQTLQVSDMLQKCFIDVDEKGTEAAAVTMSRSCLFSGSDRQIFRFHATSPFIFFVFHRSSGIVLFCGCVTDPSA